jgi:hypothetical protein
MTNRRFLNLATFGLPATGLVVPMDISGCRALGCSHQPSGYCGRLVIGAGGMAFMCGMLVTGGRTSASTAELITALAMAASGTKAGVGKMVFAYNRTVNNFGSVTISNVYEKTVIVDPVATRVSFNGGSGGTTVRPTPEQEAAAHEQHIAAAPTQFQHERTASANKALLATENHGQPTIAATTKPNEFAGKGVVTARQAEPSTTPVETKPTGATAVGPNPTGPKGLDKKERAVNNQNGGAPMQLGNAETNAPRAASLQPPHTENPQQAGIKPAPPSPLPHTEHPEQAVVKPASPPPPHTEQPAQAGIKPASPLPAVAPAAARPAPAATRPICPPGKTLAEVNGHQVCR